MNRSEIQKARLEEAEFQKAYEELFGETFEKAHKDGDTHPNGKWVWVSSANGGKGDWRTINGRAHKKMLAAGGGGNGGATGSGKTGGGENKVADKPVKTDKPAAKTKKITEQKNNGRVNLTAEDYHDEESLLRAAAFLDGNTPSSKIKVGAKVWSKISKNLWTTGSDSSRSSKDNIHMLYEMKEARKRGKKVDTSKVIVNNDSVWQNKEFSGIAKLGEPDMKQVNDEDYDSLNLLKYESMVKNEELKEKHDAITELRKLINADADRETLQQASNRIATSEAKMDKIVLSLAKLKQAKFEENNDVDEVFQSGDVKNIIKLGKPDIEEIKRQMQNNPKMVIDDMRDEIQNQIVSSKSKLRSYLESGKRDKTHLQDMADKIATLNTFDEVLRNRTL